MFGGMSQRRGVLRSEYCWDRQIFRMGGEELRGRRRILQTGILRAFKRLTAPSSEKLVDGSSKYDTLSSLSESSNDIMIQAVHDNVRTSITIVVLPNTLKRVS